MNIWYLFLHLSLQVILPFSLKCISWSGKISKNFVLSRWYEHFEHYMQYYIALKRSMRSVEDTLRIMGEVMSEIDEFSWSGQISDNFHLTLY